MLFATKTLDKIGKGQGTWGDLALVGITAASFTVLPAKLVMLSGGALMTVIKAASKVTTSKKASVAAKRAAARTLEDALTIRRQGRNAAIIPDSKTNFPSIWSPAPPYKFVPEGPPVDKYNPRNQGIGRTIDEDYDVFKDRDRNPAQEVDDYIASQGPKRNLGTGRNPTTKEELEAEEKLKEILSSGMYDKIEYTPDEIEKLISKLTPEEKVLLKGANKNEVIDYVRTGEYERIPVPGAGRRAANADALRRIHSGNYTDDEILEATEALQKWNATKIKKDAEETTAIYLSIRRLLKDEKLKKGTVPPDILKYFKTHFPDIKKEFKEKVVATAEGKAILKTYEKEQPLQRFVEKDIIGKGGEVVAQQGDLRPNYEFIRYEEAVDDAGNLTGKLDKIFEKPTIFESDDLIDMTQPILKGPTRVRKSFPTVRIEDVPEVIFKTTDSKDVRRASALFAEREKLNIFSKSNSKNMRKADEKEIARLKESTARNNKAIDKIAVEIKDIGERLTREEKIRVQELAEIIKERQLLTRNLAFNPKNKMSAEYKGPGILNFQKINKQGREELNPSGFVQKQLDEFDENIKRKYELEDKIDELKTTVKNEQDSFTTEYYSIDSPPIESLNPQELKFMKAEEDRINVLTRELQDKINSLENELKEFKTKPKAVKPKESKVNSLIDELKTTDALKPIKSFDGNVSEVTVHSGGANGADTAWAEAADRLGIKTTGHSFEKHETMGSASGFVGKRPALETRNILTKEQLEIADEFLKKAAKSLGRPFDPGSRYVNLLRRNYYQLKDSEAVVAIGSILPGGTKVDGGTGWAVQMGIDKGIPVYVFDQKVKLWAVWNGSKFEKLSGLPPKLKEFAGVGSRELNDDGRKAIEEYMQQYVSRGTKAKVAESTGSVVKWKDKTNNTVYIGRDWRDQKNRGKFGNPYEVQLDPLKPNFRTAEEAVAEYDDYLLKRIKKDPEHARDIYSLKGKDLGCPGGEPVDGCHGQVILKAIKYLDKYPKYLDDTPKTVKGTLSTSRPIDSFKGENKFLSNMSESSFRVGQETYPTVEHFYQAMKTTNLEEQAAVLAAKTPAEAKKIGKTVTLRTNWKKLKIEIMEVGLRAKFQQNPELKKKLIDTGDADLIEGNTWGDTFWGQVDGKGENNLGKLLMKIRDQLMKGK
jgi:ribA/ribD-fused uncharacterized protein